MEFLRPKKSSLSLDMAPLIDVVFQLLIFFMLTSSFSHPALQLNLPKAKEHDRKQTEEIVVSIDRAGSVFINNRKSSLGALMPELKPLLERNSKKSVHLRGDEKMPYGNFVEVMDLARQAGAKQINIVHESGGEK